MDTSEKSRRKKNASTGENLDSVTAGQGSSDGKRALYHCNYCNKDITGIIRIKCAVCCDFDLCIECFSVGAEVHPHKSDHAYRVMDVPSFPLFCPEWSVDEEMLLLEGFEMYGYGNWAEVAVHVATKTKEECIEHYKRTEVDKKLSDTVPAKDQVDVPKMEENIPRQSFGIIKPKRANVEASSLLGGYNPKRHEFDIEYDNDAEELLADMEFNEDDMEAVHELKLRVLDIYNKRIDERKRRNDFILERNLLNPNRYGLLSEEEKELCRRYDGFMRFHSKDEHEGLIKCVLSEHRIFKEIQELKEAQAAGCRSSTEAYRYLEQKKREADDGVNRKEYSLAGQRSQGSESVSLSSDSPGTYLTSTSGNHANSFTGLDCVPISGANSLSEADGGVNRTENSQAGPSSQERPSVALLGPHSTPTSAGQANSFTDLDFVSISGARFHSEANVGVNRKENSQAGPRSQERPSVALFRPHSTPTSAGQANAFTNLNFVSISGANLLSEADGGVNRKENSQAGPRSQERPSVALFRPHSAPTSAGQANSFTDLDFVPISGANLLSEANDGGNRKENSQAGPSSQESPSVALSSDSFRPHSTTMSAGQANSFRDSDYVPMSAADLLTESEKQLCRDIGLSPKQYLQIQGDMSIHIFRGYITNRSDAHKLFQLEPVKIDKVYDVLRRKGIAPP